MGPKVSTCFFPQQAAVTTGFIGLSVCSPGTNTIGGTLGNAGGKLTASEKKQVNHQQDQASKQIYADKHNANTAHYGNNKVGQRRENQQDRIAQGIKSGQLTAGETAKLENQQKGINKQVAADRKANGGTLTTSEKKQINKDQNGASKNIYHKKHNAKTQPQAQPKR